jgi:hypothetical protein
MGAASDIATVYSSDSRLVVEGYPTLRSALGNTLHTFRFRDKSGKSVTNAAEPAVIKRGVLPLAAVPSALVARALCA